MKIVAIDLGMSMRKRRRKRCQGGKGVRGIFCYSFDHVAGREGIAKNPPDTLSSLNEETMMYKDNYELYDALEELCRILEHADYADWAEEVRNAYLSSAHTGEIFQETLNVLKKISKHRDAYALPGARQIIDNGMQAIKKALRPQI